MVGLALKGEEVCTGYLFGRNNGEEQVNCVSELSHEEAAQGKKHTNLEACCTNFMQE